MRDALVERLSKIMRRVDEFEPGWYYGVPLLVYIVLFAVIPFVLVILYSFWTFSSGDVKSDWTVENYRALVTDSGYRVLLRDTIVFSAVEMLIVLAVVVPLAYAISFVIHSKLKLLVLGVIILPFVASYVMRTFSWSIILGDTGMVNWTLMKVGLIDHPYEMLYTKSAVRIGLLAQLIPLATLLMFLTFELVDRQLIEAASNLGSPGWKSFLSVTLPLSKFGLMMTGLLAFIFSMGDYLTVATLGGGRVYSSSLLLTDTVRSTGNWSVGSAMSMILLTTMLVIVLIVFNVLGSSPKSRAASELLESTVPLDPGESEAA